MRLAVPKETAANERRVALVPEVVRKLRARGIEVVVEAGAGGGALIPDAAFTDAGATISADSGAIWAPMRSSRSRRPTRRTSPACGPARS
jgi:NAD(P) transhydrogenase subunit alpha